MTAKLPRQLPKITLGYRIGKIEVAAPTDDRKNGYTVWRCKCDCGNDIFLDTRSLQRGANTDCGCSGSLSPGQRDLTDQRFGRLTCLSPTAARSRDGCVIWQCKCDCGKDCLVSSGQLLSGNKKSCGCLSRPPRKDWIGRQFGKLTVTGYDGKRDGSHYWRCKCICGGETIVRQSYLSSGHTGSCGCAQTPAQTRHYIDGTCLEQIRSKRISRVNTSGVRGVYWHKKAGKWIAQITFKGKTRYLGAFLTIAEAAAARKKAEERYFGEFLEQYDQFAPIEKAGGQA